MMFLSNFVFLGLLIIQVASTDDFSSDIVNPMENADILYGFDEYRDRCTAIAVGPKAMIDGSTVTTHNNDCQECDIRITHVPAADWSIGSKRPVYDIRNAYPRYVDSPDNNIHGPDYLEEYVDKSIYNWTTSTPIGFIDQVPHTYAYTLGTYAIQNEKQVTIGESTCSSIFFSVPVSGGGKSLMHMETLTEIALERCDTARCAIQLMGDLGVQFGFYGGDWDQNLESAQDEAGEALTISDTNEAWMFHIMPDDSGTSAIWVAQRVPDDHITAVANQFVITTINLEDKVNFMASSNIHEVAIRNNLWTPESSKPFNFALIYGVDRHSSGFACTRRVWRVLTLAAPSLLPTFSGYTDGMGTFGFGADGKEPYPFSVKVDKPLTVQDIMNMNRDQFEGSAFDMSIGLEAGMFGDTMRFPPSSKYRDNVNGISSAEYNAGLGFERPISLWRTAYSTVAQARGNFPDAIGAVTWVAQNAPHFSSFVPVYASSTKTPSSLNTGTQYKLDKQSNWWIHCLTGNYLSRWYKYSIVDIVAFQKKIEASVFAEQTQIESTAASMIAKSKDNLKVVTDMLGNFHESIATSVHDQWWEYFFKMAGVYRDMYKVVDQHAENFAYSYRYLTVGRNWFESIGYWGPPGTPPADEAYPIPSRPINIPSEDSMEIYKAKYPNGFTAHYPRVANTVASVPSLSPTPIPSILAVNDKRNNDHPSGSIYLIVIASIVFGFVIGIMVTLFLKRNRHPYLPINS
eukprot:gene9867-13274_t